MKFVSILIDDISVIAVEFVTSESVELLLLASLLFDAPLVAGISVTKDYYPKDNYHLFRN